MRQRAIQLGPDGFAVVSPEAPWVGPQQVFGPPLRDLNGKTIGLLWDWEFRGDLVFEMICRELKTLYPDVSFVDYTKFGNIHGADEREVVAGLPKRLKEFGCHGVLVGVGS